MIKIKDFDQGFKTKLYDGVKKIEANSQAEAVVMIKHSSGKYMVYSIAAAGIVFVAAMAYFMLSPIEYDPYTMFTTSVVLGVLMALAFVLFPGLYRVAVPKKIRDKNVEIHARAIFQKAQMYKTIANTAFLVYYSLVEKKAVFLADYGVTLNTPQEEITAIENMLNAALDDKNPKAAILDALVKIAPIMAKYLPIVGDDINELPDDLDIEL
jgi:putative membrane protein